MVSIINRKTRRPKTSGSGTRPPKGPRKSAAAAAPDPDPYEAVIRVDLPVLTLENRKLLKPYEERN